MKYTFKNIRFYLSMALVAGTMMSCSEDKMDKINTDRDNPHQVDAKFILTDAITATAFSNVGGDFYQRPVPQKCTRLLPIITYGPTCTARLRMPVSLLTDVQKAVHSRVITLQKEWEKCWLPSMLL